MTVNDLYFDQIQDEQDRHTLVWQRQFAQYNEPSKELHDLNGDLITEDEVWMTDDGLVPMSQLVAYCKDKYDARICDVDMAIETVEEMGGYFYE